MSVRKSYPFLKPVSHTDATVGAAVGVRIGADEDSKGILGRLAHYIVLREMGRGGMGFVFEAIDQKLKRTVALKVMNQRIAAVPGSRKRFITEARAMAAVRHDNVVTIFEVGESDSTPFMAMEMLQGETLEARNRRIRKEGDEPFTTEQIIEYAKQLGAGLAAAHQRDIVHRDIKPANIWIEAGTGRIKILDFGLALASTPVDQLAGRGAVIGTPGYLSPEQARSDPIDDRTDLYSLGVVLYEMATGRLPINTKNVHDQLIAILLHRPRPIGELNPDLPQPLCDFIHRLIRKEPSARFEKAASLAAELDRVAEDCERQSETAMAIDKLRMGLQQVTDSGAHPTIDFGAPDPGDSGAGLLDLGNLPASPAPDPLAVASNASPASGVAATNVASSGAIKSSVAKPREEPKASTSSGTNLVPLIAIVALVIIALPVMAFVFSSMGGPSEAIVMGPVDPADYDPIPENNPTEEELEISQSGPREESQVANQASSAKPNKPNNKKPNQSKNNQNQQQKKGDAKPDNTASSDLTNVDLSASESMQKPPEAVSVETPSVATNIDVGESPKSDESIPDPGKETKAEPDAPQVSQWVYVTTADGNGADAMVQVSGKGKLGGKPAIGVRRRGDKELNHSYLRFDLSNMKDKKSIVAAKLLLLQVNEEDGSGDDRGLRVIGLPDAGIWREDLIDWRLSPSGARGAESIANFSVLLDTDDASTLESSNLEYPDMPAQVFSIGGPALAEFLRQSDKVVTLAIAGYKGDELWRFVSRERENGTMAPRLQIGLK
ncbi:MAG: protein kinase [Planctomycetota bacterium]